MLNKQEHAALTFNKKLAIWTQRDECIGFLTLKKGTACLVHVIKRSIESMSDG